MDVTHVYAADIAKASRREDGSLEFEASKATGPDLDSDRQILDPAWLKTAMPEWFTWGNLREQHSAIAAGKGTSLEERGDGWYVAGVVVDPSSARKVEAGVLKGLSVGIKGPRVVKDAAAPGGRIVDGKIVEVSLVDRPANETCKLVLAKAAGGDKPELAQVEELTENPVDKDTEPDVAKRDVSQEERDRLASEGKALPDGSFPIANVGDLRNAIKAVGRAKNTAKARAHIKRRAKALGRADLIPDEWKAEEAEVRKLLEAQSIDELRKAMKPDYAVNLDVARQNIAALIVGEAQDTAAGQDEVGDMECLLSCLRSLRYFELCESQEDTSMDISLGTVADLVKAATADGADDAAKTTLDELRKALGLDALDRLTTDIEATKASAERISTLEGRLAEVEKMAAPGGPVRAPSPADAVKAAQASRREQADRFRQLADTIVDRELAAAYRHKAAELDATA